MKSAILVALGLVISLTQDKPFGRIDDYYLSDQFIIEMSNTKTGESGIELWDILLVRSLINTEKVKMVHTQLNLTEIELYSLSKDQYIIKGVYRLDYDPEYDDLFFDDGSFSFTLGMDKKLHIKFDFNKDGSLSDITGSNTDFNAPDNVTTYKLIKENKDLNIRVENKFPSGFYTYKRRH